MADDFVPWEDVVDSPRWNELTPQNKVSVAQRWIKNSVVASPKFQSLDRESQNTVLNRAKNIVSNDLPMDIKASLNGELTPILTGEDSINRTVVDIPVPESISSRLSPKIEQPSNALSKELPGSIGADDEQIPFVAEFQKEMNQGLDRFNLNESRELVRLSQISKTVPSVDSVFKQAQKSKMPKEVKLVPFDKTLESITYNPYMTQDEKNRAYEELESKAKSVFGENTIVIPGVGVREKDSLIANVRKSLGHGAAAIAESAAGVGEFVEDSAGIMLKKMVHPFLNSRTQRVAWDAVVEQTLQDNSISGDAAKHWRRIQESIRPNVEPSSGQEFVFKTVSTLVSQVPNLAASALGGLPAALAVAGTQGFGSQFTRARQEGYGFGTATLASVLSGITEAATEKISISKYLAPSKNIAKSIMQGMLGETQEEMLSEILQVAIDRKVLDKDVSLKEAMGRMVDAGLMAATTGGIISTGFYGAGKAGLVSKKGEVDSFITQFERHLQKEEGREIREGLNDSPVFAMESTPTVEEGVLNRPDIEDEALQLVPGSVITMPYGRYSIKNVGDNLVSLKTDTGKIFNVNKKQLERDVNAERIRRKFGISDSVSVARALKDMIIGDVQVHERPVVDESEIPKSNRDDVLSRSSKPIDSKILKKVESAINTSAKPSRREIEFTRTKELSKRVAAASKLARDTGGRKGAEAASAQLAGELPVLTMTPLSESLTESEFDSLLDHVENHEDLPDFFSRHEVKKNLINMYEYGAIPSFRVMSAIEKSLGSKVANAINKNIPTKDKAKSIVVEVLGAPRALKASFDLSGTLRQGFDLVMVDPKRAARAFNSQIKAFGNEGYARDMDNTIRTRPLAELADRFKLAVTSFDGMGINEEQFMSHIVQKVGKKFLADIPGRSERAFVTYLNKLRADTFDSFALELIDLGYDPDTVEGARAFAQLATMVNAATGRGNLPKALSGDILTTLLFSPRFVASRFQNLVLPVIRSVDPRTPKPIRDIAVKQLYGKAITYATMYSLASMASDAFKEDMEFNVDPSSSDFLKFRFGNARVDMGAGYGQVIRFLYGIATGNQRDLGTGNLKTVNKKKILGRFFSNKLAPIPAVLLASLENRTPGYEELTPINVIKALFAPIPLESLVEANKEFGIRGNLLLTPLDILGLNASIFSEKASTPREIRSRGLSRSSARKKRQKLIKNINNPLPSSR